MSLSTLRQAALNAAIRAVVPRISSSTTPILVSRRQLAVNASWARDSTPSETQNLDNTNGSHRQENNGDGWQSGQSHSQQQQEQQQDTNRSTSRVSTDLVVGGLAAGVCLTHRLFGEDDRWFFAVLRAARP